MSAEDDLKFAEERIARFQVAIVEIEKELCSILGRPWTPTGISVESLLKQVRDRLESLPDDVRREDEELRSAFGRGNG